VDSLRTIAGGGKDKFKKYNDDRLLEELIMKVDQYLPEGLTALKEEFKNRGYDLKKLLLKEYKKSGIIKKVFQNVTHLGVYGEFDPEKECTGNLYFTSKCIFYLPFKIINNTYNVSGMAGSAIGMLGIKLFSEITSKRAKNFKDHSIEELPPLSLLAKFIKGSICFKNSEIKKVIFVKGVGNKFLFKTIEKRNDDVFPIHVKDIEEFKSTIRECGILLEEKELKGFSKFKDFFSK